MSATNQGSEERGVEAETRDGSDSTIVGTLSDSDVSTVVPPGSSGEASNDDILGVSDNSMASEHNVVKETFSNRDEDFDPDLPTGYTESSQVSSAKDKVAEKDIDEGNSEKIAPALEKKDSMMSAEASKPTATLEINTSLTKLEESLNSPGDDSVLKELGLKVMLTKKDFKDSFEK